ncbi:DUF1840 domain-containing protein [Thioalkalivibrio sulfidiphilus]|uniref:DUF1840 domain-containing protein n=1 Tax=Thioalkalivibrio sulfidiphilus TaxID=1033854 RepID=UPI00036016C0|nr:DUF1840 domain-containing protein [Thioalkalivibrio sulfidiphilus]
MLITFKTPAHGDLTFFGDVAQEFIRIMGHSGSVPGALDAQDVPAALQSLRAALERGELSAHRDTRGEEEAEQDEDEIPVPLQHRALPLIELLEAAAASRQYVMWESK